MGPVLAIRDEILHPNALVIKTFSTANIEFLSGSTSLQPGAVIVTGTPRRCAVLLLFAVMRVMWF